MRLGGEGGREGGGEGGREGKRGRNYIRVEDGRKQGGSNE